MALYSAGFATNDARSLYPRFHKGSAQTRKRRSASLRLSQLSSPCSHSSTIQRQLPSPAGNETDARLHSHHQPVCSVTARSLVRAPAVGARGPHQRGRASQRGLPSARKPVSSPDVWALPHDSTCAGLVRDEPVRRSAPTHEPSFGADDRPGDCRDLVDLEHCPMR